MCLYSLLSVVMADFSAQDWYVIILQTMTIIIVLLYIFTYIYAFKNLDPVYLKLLSTGRTLLLASVLIFFYNPLRKTFDYGHSMPFFAFSAGISLLFMVDKHDILNLVNFILYGKSIDNKTP